MSPKTDAGSRVDRLTLSGRPLVIGCAAMVVLLIGSAAGGFSMLFGMLAFTVLATAIYVLATGKRSWARVPSKPLAVVALLGSFLLFGVSAWAAPSGASPDARSAMTVQSDNDLGDTGATESATPTPTRSATPKSTPKPTPTATPTVKAPVVEVREEVINAPVAFGAVTANDASADLGTSWVSTTGAEGVRSSTFRVTVTDGVETGREMVADVVTTPPVDQVTTVGTKPAPVAAPAPAASTCDPNYGGCVPIASDVDCAGGSGNGPAYVDGIVAVIGSDIYDLDRDNNGFGCD